MKNKIVLIAVVVIFIAGLVLANDYMNNSNKKEETQEIVTKNDVISVSSENFQEEVLKSDKKVLIDFYADWCEPCKMVSPIVEAVASENSNVKFVKINVDENEDLATVYRIMYIPTLLVIENGEEANRLVGYAEKDKIEEMIK